METNGESLDGPDAVAGLEAIAAAQRGVRDQPWPKWLYVSNTLLLGAMALTPLIKSSMVAALVVLVLGVSLAGSNYRAGVKMGTPYAVPTSKLFRGAAMVAGACVVAPVFLRDTVSPQVIIALAVGAVVSYGGGSIVHYRSTRR